jgi:hypothetical protein
MSWLIRSTVLATLALTPLALAAPARAVSSIPSGPQYRVICLETPAPLPDVCVPVPVG